MRRLAIIAAALLLSGTSAPAQPSNGEFGQVNFANSGAPAAQQAFHRGLALLHNFQYPAAVKAFEAAQAADPDFAMAYWGHAMAQNYTVWMEQHPEKARSALAKLGPTREARLAKAKTPRERALLDAVETLYGAGTKEQRDFAYSAKMEQLYRAYPKDVDIAAFYALSLLGLAHKGRDYGLYMQAAAILEEFFPAYQRHPGVVHYLIHSYDDPTHAPLGLRAARLYGAIAPESHHAHHMTSHIFIALPDWAATIEANKTATAIANAERQAQGKRPLSCGHYQNWAHYAFLQTAQPAKAAEILSGCREDAAFELANGRLSDRGSIVGAYATLRSQWIVETGKAPAIAPLAVPADSHPAEAVNLAYGDLLLARGNASAAMAAAARMKAIAPKVPLATLHPLASKGLQIMLLQADGLSAIAAGKREEGIAALQKAADVERLMEVPFGPPMVEKPSFELLAEELTAAGRASEAAEAYRMALKMAPGRKLSAAGLALAARPPEATATAAAGHKH